MKKVVHLPVITVFFALTNRYYLDPSGYNSFQMREGISSVFPASILRSKVISHTERSVLPKMCTA